MLCCARTPHGDSSPDCNCFVKSVIRLSDTVSRWRKSDSGTGSYNLSSQIWLWRGELCPAQWSRLLNTLNRGNLRRSEKPKMSDRRSRTNQSQIENVESRGANYNTEDSLNHFKMSMSSINYSNDLRIITLVSLYIQCTMYYNICFLFYVRVRNEILGITNVGLSLCQSNLNICHRLSPSGTRVLTSGDWWGLVTRAWSASDQSHY